MVDSTLSSSVKAYISDSHRIPCGILIGALTNYSVQWDITIPSIPSTTSLLRYHSSQGNQTETDNSGRYSYDPVTSTLTVTNFTGLGAEMVELTCTVDTSNHLEARIVNVTITYGELGGREGGRERGEGGREGREGGREEREGGEGGRFFLHII